MKSPHQLTRNQWIEENRVKPSLTVNDSMLEQDSFEPSSYKTVVLDNFLHKVDNPILHIKKAIEISTDKILIVVPDSQRSEKEISNSKREYIGRSLFDQCMKAGAEESQIKIDHLNEFPEVYWLASCNI